jgi:negative regulator of sigma E activity
MMTRIIDEQISALLDGELPVEQEEMLLSRFDREPESREKLARYGLIGELVRDHSQQYAVPRFSVSEISARVAAVIDEQFPPDSADARTPSSPSSTVGLGWVGAGIAAMIALVVMLNLGGIGIASDAPVKRETSLVASIPVVTNSPRLTRYLVSHAQFSNSASRHLLDSHLAMQVNSLSAWTGHE